MVIFKRKVNKAMKSNIDSRKHRLTVNRIEEWFFSPPPSFYAIVSGALIGIATSLLTGLLFAQEVRNNTILLAIFFIFLSSVCFCFISIIIEQLRAEVTGEGEATRKLNFRGEIHRRREILWTLSIGGLVSIVTGITLIYYAMRC